ncbi:OmpA family protein [Devosia sp.]|uniref:OmpA family protein n=1 Tax=Devosia sp. TaxID=1871048 RepID=UPI003BAC0237
MSGIFLRWGIPAFITVISTTAAAIATSASTIPNDLTTRAAAALTAPELSWAQVSFDMQDAVLNGTATTQKMVDEAIARVAEVRGVRSVTSNIVLAEFAKPYPFVATVADGRITLSGGVPDASARDDILKIAGNTAADKTRPLSGAPDRATWLAAVTFALKQAQDLDEGEVAVADLDVTLSGRAKSPEAYDDLLLVTELAPPGVKMAFHEIQPALASPFEWHAVFDGKHLDLSGSVPNSDVARDLAALVPAGISITNSLTPASGAPEEFADHAKVLLQNLLLLENGSATISDTKLSLEGAPADEMTAKAVQTALAASDVELSLGAPKVAQYVFKASRAGDKVRLDGFVPDKETLQRLASQSGIDTGGLQLGRGEPDHFQSGVDFVLAAVQKMSEGEASISGEVLTVKGRAASVDAYAAVESALAAGAPQGLTLGSSEVRPPIANPFTFAVEKTADGTYAFGGFVPDQSLLTRLQADAAKVGKAEVAIADGNPADFESVSLKAVKLLGLVDHGLIQFDGKHWSFDGAVGSAANAKALQAAVDQAGLGGPDWTVNIAQPAVPALPVIDPYVWHAQKASDGTLTVTGFVPDEDVKAQLTAEVKDKLQDGTSLGAGAPESFGTASIAAARALAGLESGTADYSASGWTLTGTAATTADRHSVEGELQAAVDTSTWHISIQAKDAAPVVTPFVWSATKSADGSVALSGYVPTETLRSALAAQAGKVSEDRSLVGSGEPEGFAADVSAGLAALTKLVSGEVHYDGRAWSVSGQPGTEADAKAVKDAISAASDRGASWQLALLAPVTAPEPVVAAVEPTPDIEKLPPVAPVAPPAGAPKADEETKAPESATTSASVPAETAAVATTPVPVAPVEPPAEPKVAAVPRNFVFDVKKSADGKLEFVGSVAVEADRSTLATAAGTKPPAALAVGPGLPPNFSESAAAGTRALAMLTDGELGLDGQTWVLSGRAETDVVRQSAINELASLPAAKDWQVDVSLLPGLEVCQNKVAALAARNDIRFESGGAKLLKESLTALDELANDLAACKEATVNVEGHTDADGDADANLALSVARAEAVVDALIVRGVAPERLYAVGYGESLPIASNETRAGKQANRRIAFSITDH